MFIFPLPGLVWAHSWNSGSKLCHLPAVKPCARDWPTSLYEQFFLPPRNSSLQILYWTISLPVLVGISECPLCSFSYLLKLLKKRTKERNVFMVSKFTQCPCIVDHLHLHGKGGDPTRSVLSKSIHSSGRVSFNRKTKLVMQEILMGLWEVEQMFRNHLSMGLMSWALS